MYGSVICHSVERIEYKLKGDKEAQRKYVTSKPYRMSSTTAAGIKRKLESGYWKWTSWEKETKTLVTDKLDHIIKKRYCGPTGRGLCKHLVGDLY